MNTRLLLACATLLITNSHLERFYPSPLFAGDGLLGNSIFFMVAGMGVTLSARQKRRPFFEYYWRRIIRIYPTVIIVVTIFLVGWLGKWRVWGWRDYVLTYLFPTPWAFIAQIMVCYIVLYPFLLAPSQRKFGIALLLLVPAFAWAWAAHPQDSARLVLGLLDLSIYYVFWFAMVLLGAWLACGKMEAAGSVVPKLVWFALAFAAYVALKFLFVTGRVAHFQFLLFVLVALLVWLLARIAQSHAVTAFLERSRRTTRAIDWLASLTLEIYTIQIFLAERDDLSRRIPFPLNIVVFFILLLLLAWGVKYLATRVTGEARSRPAVA